MLDFRFPIRNATGISFGFCFLGVHRLPFHPVVILMPRSFLGGVFSDFSHFPSPTSHFSFGVDFGKGGFDVFRGAGIETLNSQAIV